MSIKIYLPTIYWLHNRGDIDKVKTCLALGVDINTLRSSGENGNYAGKVYINNMLAFRH